MATRRSASRNRAAPARSRSVMAPSSRVSAPISSRRSLENATSRRSMSIRAVRSASAVSGRLIRSESQPASSRAMAPARASVTTNQRSTSWRNASSPASEWATTMRADTNRAASVATAGTTRESTTPPGGGGGASARSTVSSETTRAESGARCARNAESTVTPPTRVNGLPTSRKESTRASARNGASAVRARTSAIPFGAAASRRGSPGSRRSNSLRKCPELTMWPSPSWTCSMENPARRIAFPA